MPTKIGGRFKKAMKKNIKGGQRYSSAAYHPSMFHSNKVGGTRKKNRTKKHNKSKKQNKSKKYVRKYNKNIIKGGDYGDSEGMFYDQIDCDNRYKDKPIKRKACKAMKGTAIATGEGLNIARPFVVGVGKLGESVGYGLTRGDEAYNQDAVLKDVPLLSTRQQQAYDRLRYGKLS